MQVDETTLDALRELAAGCDVRSMRAALVIADLTSGRTKEEIAIRFGTNRQTVGKWCSRFARYGIEGLRSLPNTGRPPAYTPELRQRVRELRGQGLPYPKIAGEVGIHPSAVFRIVHRAER